MSAESSRAVFLSYASQDAEAAQRVCEALRAAGIEVWFDQSELTGGDAWDAKIRGQIGTCALFVPIVSASTQARLEGYFRIEWKLAAQRTHAMAEAKPFLVPVVIDATRDINAHVPSEFRAVQWTRLPGGETSEKFCERVRKLLEGEVGPRPPSAASEMKRPGAAAVPGKSRRWLLPTVVALACVSAIGIWQPWKNTAAKPAVALTEARKLTLQARALIDDDWLAGRENFRLAEELCQRAVTLAPDDGEAWATAARVSMETIRRRYDITSARQAVTRTQVERAIRLAPASVEAGLAMAAHVASRGNSAEAERRLRDLNRRAPQDARVLLMLARVLNYATIRKDAEATAIRLRLPVFAGRVEAGAIGG